MAPMLSTVKEESWSRRLSQALTVLKSKHCPSMINKKNRILKIDTHETLPSLHIYNSISPKFPEGASFSPAAKNNQGFYTCIEEYYGWLLCRVVSGHAVWTTLVWSLVTNVGAQDIPKSSLMWSLSPAAACRASWVPRHMAMHSFESRQFVKLWWGFC